MGVEDDDLCMVFDILDEDGNGAVTHAEFAHQLYKMKTQEVQTVVCFIKHYVEDMRKTLLKLDPQKKTREPSINNFRRSALGPNESPLAMGPRNSSRLTK